MTNLIADTPRRKAARIAGVLFLLSFMVPFLNWIFVLSRFIVAGNAVDTARSILANEALFRIGIINGLLTSAVTVALTLALYAILRSVNKALALLAVCLKMTEAVLVAAVALGNHVALLVLKGQASTPALDPERTQALVGQFLNASLSVSAVPMVFLGLNMMVFLHLLFKSNYVPRPLAGFGILSYALIFMHAVTSILFPNAAMIMTVQVLCWAPSCLFELTIGPWLLLKGVKDLRLTSSAAGGSPEMSRIAVN